LLKKKKKLFKYWQLYLLVLPALVYTIIFDYGPMYGIIIAFKDFSPKKGYLGSDWVGLKHFIRFVTYPDFWDLIRNTLSISLYSLATFPCAIIFALLLNEVKNNTFKKTVQMVTYAPHFLSTVVMCGMIRLFVEREGVLGRLFGLISGKAEHLLTVPGLFNDIYVWSGVWQGIGWGTILYLSALSGVPGELIDAAKIDGAGRLQVIRHINIPCIMSTIVISFIMSTGGLLSVGYEKVLLLQTDLNLEVSRMISTYTYEVGLVGAQFSYSTAINLFNTLVNIILLLIANFICKKVSGIGIW